MYVNCYLIINIQLALVILKNMYRFLDLCYFHLFTYLIKYVDFWNMNITLLITFFV